MIDAKRVLRAFDRGDRRRSILRLSAAGRAVYTRVAPMALRYEAELLSALSPNDQRTLDRLLARLHGPSEIHASESRRLGRTRYNSRRLQVRKPGLFVKQVIRSEGLRDQKRSGDE